MTLSKVEQAVRVERRRKKRALRGHKNEALFRLKAAVTAALQMAACRTNTVGDARGKARNNSVIPNLKRGALIEGRHQ